MPPRADAFTRSRAARSLLVVVLLLTVTVARVAIAQPGHGVGYLALLPIVLAAFWLGTPACWASVVAAVALFVGSEVFGPTPLYPPDELPVEAAFRAAVYAGVAALVTSLLRRERAAIQRAAAARDRASAEYRARRAGDLLVALGRIQGSPEDLADRLTGVARASVNTFGELATVSRPQPDGSLRSVAAACPDRPELEAVTLALPAHRLPAAIDQTYRAGRPFVVAPAAESLRRIPDVADLDVRLSLGVRSALVVPLVSGDDLLGTLTFSSLTGERDYREDELDLAAEVGRRVSSMIESDQLITRERLRHGIVTALAAAATATEAATVLCTGIRDAVGADVVGVCVLREDGLLHLLHTIGYPPEQLAAFAATEPGDRYPFTDAARSGRPVWLSDREDRAGRYPALELQPGSRASMALPLLVEGRVVGTVAASFPTQRRFPADERSFLLTVAAQAALVLDRAATADGRLADGARMRALVDGLQAIVWEADAVTGEFIMVSDRAEDVLGYPASRWLGDPDFWPALIHPDDRGWAVQTCRAATAEGRDNDFCYRALTADGRVVWLHDLVHVVRDAAGRSVRLQGIMIDVTEQKRRERAAELLAEAGRLLSGPDSTAARLTGVAELAVGDLCDQAVIRLRGDDGRYAPVAAAPAAVAREVLGWPPVPMAEQLVGAMRDGRAFVVPRRTDEMVRSACRNEAEFQAHRRILGEGSALVVPLLAAGRVVGTLALVAARDRRYDDAEIALAEEIGRRLTTALEAERVATRQRQLQRITTALAVAEGLDAVADALLGGLVDVLGAGASMVFVVDPAAGALRLIGASGFGPQLVERLRIIPLDAAMLIADCARERTPIWLPEPGQWRERYPLGQVDGARAGLGHRAGLALPMLVGGRVVGVLAGSFAEERDFAADERDFAMTLAGQAAQAFERAADADQRRDIAETLQHSLLPSKLPELDRVAVTAHYQPAASGTEAGGDWYDVLPFPDGRVAVVVGDVVGQGPAAAAVMGQLRSALAAYLLDGHRPAAALARLSRFVRRVPGALASTAVCVVLDPAAGRLSWARAGHPPPLLLDAVGARYLDGAVGAVLGLADELPYVGATTELAAGCSLLLYTDGLIERRGENIDDGFDRLVGAAAGRHSLAPDRLLPALLADALGGLGPADDIAAVVARVLPGPLACRLPAQPTRLFGMRREVAAWAAAHGLARELTEDLQLALGEAVTNSIEHGYADRPAGEVSIELTGSATAVRVEVTDAGTWRPKPASPGFRGRGLAMIRAVATDVRLDTRGPGTRLSFVLPAATDRATAAPTAPARRPTAPAGTHPSGGRPERIQLDRCDPAGEIRWRLRGELDLASVPQLRPDLLGTLADTDGPVVLDLRDVSYLGSAGVRLLVEVAAEVPGRLRLEANGLTARVLTIAGLDVSLDMRLETASDLLEM